MRQAGFYPAGERHHVVRIPAAAQAEAHPRYIHVPSRLFNTTVVVHIIYIIFFIVFSYLLIYFLNAARHHCVGMAVIGGQDNCAP